MPSTSFPSLDTTTCGSECSNANALQCIPELTHHRGRAHALPDDISDDHADSSIAEEDGVVPIASHVDPARARKISRCKLDTVGGGEALGEHASLQRFGDPPLRLVPCGSIECLRPLADEGDQPLPVRRRELPTEPRPNRERAAGEWESRPACTGRHRRVGSHARGDGVGSVRRDLTLITVETRHGDDIEPIRAFATEDDQPLSRPDPCRCMLEAGTGDIARGDGVGERGSYLLELAEPAGRTLAPVRRSRRSRACAAPCRARPSRAPGSGGWGRFRGTSR